MIRAQLFVVVALAWSSACANSVDDGNAPSGQGSANDGAQLVRGDGGLEFISITNGRSYENGFLLSVRAPAATRRVDFTADGVAAASSTNSSSGFSVSITVASVGYTVVNAKAYDGNGRQVGEVQAGIIIEDRDVFEFISPSTDGGTYVNGVWFKTRGPVEVAKVRYTANGYPLGESTDVAGDFAVRYVFSQLGLRSVRAEAFDLEGRAVGTLDRDIIVVAEGGSSGSGSSGGGSSGGSVATSVPYFYQYANSLSPGASCQNTSIAMVLAAFGWTGRPDDITTEWGRARAQSPAGLELVFNTLAERAGLSARIDANVGGTIAGLRALLAAGKPTIVHGYFTSSGHVLVATGFDGTHYTVNDPAGTWSRAFMGGYPNGWEPTAGRGIRYPKDAFERAIASFDGSTIADGSLWYHELR